MSKNILLERLAAEQDTLLKIMKTCPVQDSVEDTLQDWYLFVYEKNFKTFTVEVMFPKGKLNQGLVYVVMKNFVLDRIRKANNNNKRLEKAYQEYLSVHGVEESRDSIEENISYEYNMSLLEDFSKSINKKDYEDILKLLSGKLLSEFRKNGDVDMKSYQARRYQLSKIIDELKKKSKDYKYMFPDDVSSLAKYDDLNIKNIKNK